MKNKKRICLILIAAGFIFVLHPCLFSVDLKTSKGIKLSVFPDNDALYFHAEILIRFSPETNAVISYLTYLNIFNEKVSGSKSRVLNSLLKLGNDAEIVYGGDHIIVKVNFLQNRLTQFIQLLKKITDFGNFSLKNFLYSLKNFRQLFFLDKNWEKIVATRIAKKSAFNKVDITSEYILSDKALKKINLSQVRSFYKRNFVLKNISVAVKGKVNPYIFLGLVEKTFRNYRKQSSSEEHPVRRKLRNERKTIIINTGAIKNGFDIFWFIPVPPKNTLRFNLIMISNNILFGYPLGSISKMVSNAGVKNFRISSSVCEFMDISFICNRVRLAKSADVRKFLFIANNSFRKLLPGRISKKEFLSSYNGIVLGKQVQSDNIDYEPENKIRDELIRQNYFKFDIGLSSFRNKNISFINFKNYIGDRTRHREFQKIMKRGSVIIFGNAARIVSGGGIDDSYIIEIR